MSFADPNLLISWLLLAIWSIVLLSWARRAERGCTRGLGLLGGIGATLLLITAQAGVVDLVADSSGLPPSIKRPGPGSSDTATTVQPRS